MCLEFFNLGEFSRLILSSGGILWLYPCRVSRTSPSNSATWSLVNVSVRYNLRTSVLAIHGYTSVSDAI